MKIKKAKEIPLITMLFCTVLAMAQVSGKYSLPYRLTERGGIHHMLWHTQGA